MVTDNNVRICSFILHEFELNEIIHEKHRNKQLVNSVYTGTKKVSRPIQVLFGNYRVLLLNFRYIPQLQLKSLKGRFHIYNLKNKKLRKNAEIFYYAACVYVLTFPNFVYLKIKSCAQLYFKILYVVLFVKLFLKVIQPESETVEKIKCCIALSVVIQSFRH